MNQKRYILFSLSLIFFVSCKFSTSNSKTKSNDDNSESYVYKFDYDSSFDDFGPNGAIDPATVEKSEYTETADDGITTTYKAYKVSGRKNWWNFAHLDASFFEPKTSYLIYVTLAHVYENSTNLYLNFEYNDTEENTQNTGIKVYYAESGKFCTIGGTLTTPETYTKPYLNIYSFDGDYYISDVTITKITRTADNANAEPSLYSLTDEFMIGTLFYTEALTDTEVQKVIKHHFNIYSMGNYLFLDQNTCKENSAEDMNTNPAISTTEADKYYEIAKETGAKVRGHALIHDGTTYDWFFRENYESDGDEVSAATLRLRLEHYIENVIKYYETNYPGITYCYDVINEGLTGYYGEGYYDENDEYHVRKYWDEAHTSVNKFNTILGRDYFKLVFAYARKYCNKYNSNIKLFYNDYASFDLNAEHFVKVAAWLNNGEALYDENGDEIVSYDGEKLDWSHLIDGVGIEGYYGIGQDGEGGFYANNGLDVGKSDGFVANAVRIYAKAGLEVHFTETTIANYDSSETSQAHQAELIGSYISMLIAVNKELKESVGYSPVTAVDMWNVIDNPFIIKGEYSYGLAGLYSGIFDYALQPKQSFYAMKNALQ